MTQNMDSGWYIQLRENKMEDEKMDWVHIDIKLSISRDDTDRYIDIIRKDTFRIPTPDSSFEFIHREYSSRIYKKDNETDEEWFKRALLIFYHNVKDKS